MPFPCGQTWTGSTRSGHSPSWYAVDWNRPDDVDDQVVASAPGTVTTADSTSTRSYGHYVRITHANGESTIYAHLNAVAVAVGQYVDQGALIGTVGATGNASGPHLHYEQRVGSSVSPAYFSGAAFTYGSSLTSRNCVDVPLAGNVVGNAVSELGFFRRDGKFHITMPDGTEQVVAFGRPTDNPFLGDWDGDGYVDVGVRRPESSTWYLKLPTQTVSFAFGLPSDRPFVGDWDGDGKAQVGVYRPSTKTFYCRNADGTWMEVPFGDADDQPVAGDWNGDGLDDIGTWDPSTGVWTLRVNQRGMNWFAQAQWGTAGDIPVVGDWDGNGVSDLGAWRPREGRLYQRVGSARVPARRTTSHLLGDARRTR
jgi:hypothetical protein